MNEEKAFIYLKSRSVRSVISTGYRFYSDHFKAIFAYSWIGALIYALLKGSINTFYVIKYPYLLAVSTMAEVDPYSIPEDALLTYCLLIGCTILSFFLFPLIVSFGFSVLRYHKEQHAIPCKVKWYSTDYRTLWRCVKGFLCVAVLLALVTVIMVTIDHYLLARLATVTRIVALCVLGILAMMVNTPLLAVGTQYVIGHEAFWSSLIPNYRIAFRHWGLIFLTALVNILVSLLLLGITTLPALILLTAHIKAQEGALNGDPMGIPDYMHSLTWIVFVIAAFIQAFVILLILHPFYYMCGAIEQQEVEKAQLKNQPEEK